MRNATQTISLIGKPCLAQIRSREGNVFIGVCLFTGRVPPQMHHGKGQVGYPPHSNQTWGPPPPQERSPSPDIRPGDPPPLQTCSFGTLRVTSGVGH